MKPLYIPLVACFLLAFSPLSNAASLSDDLVGHYKFDGNALDSSPSQNHGSYDSATFVEDRFGKPNSAIKFVYTGTPHLVTPQTRNPEVFTLSLWCKREADTGGTLIGLADSDRQIGTDSGRFLHFYIYPGRQVYLFSENRDQDGWHHVAATLSSDGMKLYLDGDLVGHNPNETSSKGMPTYWCMGNANAVMDDVKIFDRALTGEEISELYQADLNTCVCGCKLIPGPKGDPGKDGNDGISIKGDKGDRGEGLESGSILFLDPIKPTPPGYTKIGTMELNPIKDAQGKHVKKTVSVLQKN